MPASAIALFGHIPRKKVGSFDGIVVYKVGVCPYAVAEIPTAGNLVPPLKNSAPSAPVVEQVFTIPVASNTQNKAFEYEAIFAEELEKKHQDKSYRYFNNINRLAQKFPLAHTAKPQEEVTVWCSNDYLGMSKHPKVLESMR